MQKRDIKQSFYSYVKDLVGDSIVEYLSNADKSDGMFANLIRECSKMYKSSSPDKKQAFSLSMKCSLSKTIDRRYKIFCIIEPDDALFEVLKKNSKKLRNLISLDGLTKIPFLNSKMHKSEIPEQFLKAKGKVSYSVDAKVSMFKVYLDALDNLVVSANVDYKVNLAFRATKDSAPAVKEAAKAVKATATKTKSSPAKASKPVKPAVVKDAAKAIAKVSKTSAAKPAKPAKPAKTAPAAKKPADKKLAAKSAKKPGPKPKKK